ncbi:MAG: TrkA family potassium uptake protein [Chloroflexota bacterium]
MNKKEFAVIGLGRFGSAVALTLEKYGHHVLGIDEDEELVQQMAGYLTHVMSLDATNEAALRSIDIQSFDTVIVAIGSDFESSVLTTVSLKLIGVNHVVCKAPTRKQEEILLRVGADKVVRPEDEAGSRLAQSLSAPDMLDQFSLGPDYIIAEFIAPQKICNLTLKQSDLRQKFDVTILVIKRKDDIIVNPSPVTIVQAGDLLVLLGHVDSINEFAEMD